MADQKLQLRYSSSEDRILIISGSSANDRRSFALTRRLVRRLWPGLNQLISVVAPAAIRTKGVAVSKPAPAQVPLQSRPASQPEAGDSMPTIRRADEKTAGVAEDSFDKLPTPDSHLLVRKLQLVDRGAKPRLLVLTANEATLQVPVDIAQLAQIYEAIRTLIERADWAIDLDDGLSDPAGEPTTQRESDIDITADSPSRYRH